MRERRKTRYKEKGSASEQQFNYNMSKQTAFMGKTAAAVRFTLGL